MVKTASKRKRNFYIAIILGLILFLVISILYMSGVFDKIEYVMLNGEFLTRNKIEKSADMKFNFKGMFSGFNGFKNNAAAFLLKGLRKITGKTHYIESDKIITFDIDENAIEKTVGRWPWTWNVHTNILNLLETYNAKFVTFSDIYFDEESPVNYPEKTAENIQNELLQFAGAGDYNNVYSRLPKYTENFLDKIKNMDNVFFCNKFMFPEGKLSRTEILRLEKEREKFHSASKKERIKALSKQALNAKEAGNTNLAYDVFPPLVEISKLSKGVGHNIIILDSADGVVRRIPMIIEYHDKIYPSVSLLIAAQYFGCPYDKIEVDAGKCIRFPVFNKKITNKPVEIPIDGEGNMIINWIGDYTETFIHLPYDLLAPKAAITLAKDVLADYPFNPETFGDVFGEVQYMLSSTLLKSRMILDDKVESISQIMLIAWIIDGFIDLGFSYEECLSSVGIPDGEVCRLIWQQEEFGKMIEMMLTSGDTLPAYSQMIKDYNISDTNVGYFREAYDQIVYFYKKNNLQKIKPYYFPEKVSLSVGNKKYDISPLILKDKIIVIGLTATGLTAQNPMPFSSTGRYPMLGLIPNVVNTIITQNFIVQLPAWASYLLIFIFSMLILIFTLQSSAKPGFFFMAFFAAAYPVVGWMLFTVKGIIIPMVVPFITIIMSYFSAVLYQYYEEQKERRKVRGMFSTMVSPEVLKLMESDPDKFKLAGEKKDATMFSSDVSGFTTISEGVTAQELANILNIYLTPMSNLVMNYGGYIDKYEGDAIKADFGVPLDDPDHPWKCCYSALEQQEELKVIQRLILIKYGVKITARMGINTGEISAGNMGSEKKMQYTAMGEAVEMADGMEPLNKLFGSWIAIAPDNYERAKDKIEVRLLNYLITDFEEYPIPVHELLGWKKDFFLEHWLGKPVPPLEIEGFKKMIPEKVLSYHHYYFKVKELPESKYLTDLKALLDGLKDKCMEYFKYTDFVYVSSMKNRLKKLEEDVSNFKDKYQDKEKSAGMLEELDSLKQKSESAAEGWDKVLADSKLRLKEIEINSELIKNEIDYETAEGFGNEIDGLGKIITCLFKRITFPEEGDEVAIELAENLKLLVEDKHELYGSEDEESIKVKIDGLRNEIKSRLVEFTKDLENRADEFHRFKADFCTVSETKKKVVEIFYQGREFYLKREWDKAVEKFQEACNLDPDEGPSKMYIKRIEGYKKDPPPPEWKGEWIGEV